MLSGQCFRHCTQLLSLVGPTLCPVSLQSGSSVELLLVVLVCRSWRAWQLARLRWRRLVQHSFAGSYCGGCHYLTG